jgi:undecaprenyl-diphosphatase
MPELDLRERWRSLCPYFAGILMQLALWQILILAAVQGIAEFLPISSSGHTVILASLMYGSQTPPETSGLNIVLHLGTLGSILVYYHRRIGQLLGADRRAIGLLILGTLPAVAFALPLKLYADHLLESPLVAGLMLPVSGLVLLRLSRTPSGTEVYQRMTVASSLWIGLAQACAILPGLSRSGSTIAAGVGQGLNRPSAAAFSFLLAIPAIAGAGVLEVASSFRKTEPMPQRLDHLAIGAGVSFVVGIVALWWLNRWLERGRMHYFAWYCIALGIIVVAWQTYLRVA